MRQTAELATERNVLVRLHCLQQLNEDGPNVTDTYVAGRPVVVGGSLPGIELDELRAEGQRLFGQMVEAYGERDYRRRDASELFPPVYAPAAV